MWSNKYIKIPFAEKGRTEQGCDCWGLARLIYKQELGIELPSLLDYNNTKDSDKISDLYKNTSEKWISIANGEEQVYDIVVLNMMGSPTHIGVIVEKGVMIHCEYGKGTIIARYDDNMFQWFRKIRGFYRYDREQQ